MFFFCFTVPPTRLRVRKIDNAHTPVRQASYLMVPYAPRDSHHASLQLPWSGPSSIHKSELFCFHRANEEQEAYKQLFGCELGARPFTCLGIPIHHRKLTNREWKCIEDRFEKKLSCWKGKLMSYGGRLILINSILTSMPMFLLSFFEVPFGVRKRLDFYRSRFFWQSDELKRKYRLAKWDIICRPKDQEGLGIENLEVKNRCL